MNPDNGMLWSDFKLAASLFAVAPVSLGGVVLHARAGVIRNRWLAVLQALLPGGAHVRRVPLNIADERLIGGLDLSATLRAGRPVLGRGLLAQSDGGVIVLAMAERMTAEAAARITSVLDRGEVALERDGFADRHAARLGVVALDESEGDDAGPPIALRERLSLWIDLSEIAVRDSDQNAPDVGIIESARILFPEVVIGDRMIETLCATGLAFGVASLRSTIQACIAARAVAALEGRSSVSSEDIAIAARLVLAPRATMLPTSESEDQHEYESDESIEDDLQKDEAESAEQQLDTPDTKLDSESLQDSVLAATRAAIPSDLLARLKFNLGGARRGSSGRSGAVQHRGSRGRPMGATRGEARNDARVNVIETLRAAAPWQLLRRGELLSSAAHGSHRARIDVRTEDLRVTRYVERTKTTTIFVVDASGSSALHRLAEVKGAVQMLLAQCYIRRDQVAVLSFRGRGAELLLPPTRALARAKRSLEGLAGGGQTPLASALDATIDLVEAIKRRGDSPVVVMLTDGRANMPRSGTGGREAARNDALHAARLLRTTGVPAMLVDSSAQASSEAARLASEMGAQYLPLPYADSSALAMAVQSVNR